MCEFTSSPDKLEGRLTSTSCALFLKDKYDGFMTVFLRKKPSFECKNCVATFTTWLQMLDMAYPHDFFTSLNFYFMDSARTCTPPFLPNIMVRFSPM